MAARAWIRLGAVWVLWIVAPLTTRNNAFSCSLCRRESAVGDRVDCAGKHSNDSFNVWNSCGELSIDCKNVF